MGILNYLNEELNSPNMKMDGRSNIMFDRSRNGYEVYFKINGITYSVLAETEGTEFDDNTYKMSFRKKWAGNTEAVEDTDEIKKAFVEAINDFVDLKGPITMWWISSELYPIYNKIAESLSKKIKEYTFIDETKPTELEKELEYDIVETGPEKLYKRFIFTRGEVKEELEPKDWYERKLDDNKKTFDTFEKPDEIKPNTDHTTPFAKNGKLDKGVDYNKKKTESFLNTFLNTLGGTMNNKLINEASKWLKEEHLTEGGWETAKAIGGGVSWMILATVLPEKILADLLVKTWEKQPKFNKENIKYKSDIINFLYDIFDDPMDMFGAKFYGVVDSIMIKLFDKLLPDHSPDYKGAPKNLYHGGHGGAHVMPKGK